LWWWYVWGQRLGLTIVPNQVGSTWRPPKRFVFNKRQGDG
jgi:hypothetical protein